MLGDIVAILDSDGNIVCEYTYDAWGNVLSVTGTNMTLANLNPFRYRGYFYDTDTGFYYMQSRYYDPVTGRFINCDTPEYIGIDGTYISWNGYAYCNNDPVDNNDPYGYWAYDVHSGYKKTKYINNNRYGTYYWALICGYPDKAAWMIAESDYLVDVEYSAVTINNIAHQSWHFDTNGYSGIDTRDILSVTYIMLSLEYFNKAEQTYNENMNLAKLYMSYAYQYLGMALHPLQDKYAHTKTVTKYRQIGSYKFYEHKTYDSLHILKQADDAIKHQKIVFGIVQEKTTNILSIILSTYSKLIKSCSPEMTFKNVFPNSYKKANGYYYIRMVIK